MAVIDSLKRLFVVEEALPPQIVIPSRALSYTVHPLTVDDLHELVPLNLRCFKNGENYTWNTFKYLLSEPNALAYKVVADTSEMAGFVCVLVGETSTAHLTTIGIAPEHRRRGLAQMLLTRLDEALRERSIGTVMLEVRVGNTTAQKLYEEAGYSIVQRIASYYNNGEDGYLMMKPVY